MRNLLILFFAGILSTGCLTKATYSKRTAEIQAAIATEINNQHPSQRTAQIKQVAQIHASESPSIIPAELTTTILDALFSGGGIGGIFSAITGSLALFYRNRQKKISLIARTVANETDPTKANDILNKEKI